MLLRVFTGVSEWYTYHLYTDNLYKTKSILTISIFDKVSTETTSIKRQCLYPTNTQRSNLYKTPKSIFPSL